MRGTWGHDIGMRRTIIFCLDELAVCSWYGLRNSNNENAQANTSTQGEQRGVLKYLRNEIVIFYMHDSGNTCFSHYNINAIPGTGNLYGTHLTQRRGRGVGTDPRPSSCTVLIKFCEAQSCDISRDQQNFQIALRSPCKQGGGHQGPIQSP